MSNLRRYITNEQGERVGVLLDLEEYHPRWAGGETVF